MTLAAALTVASTLVKGVRWWVFLRRSTALRVGHVVRITVAGTGINSLLVANAGDVARVGLAARAGRAPVMAVVATLAADKATDVMAFVTMICLAFALGATSVSVGAAPWIVATAVAIVLVTWVLARSASGRHGAASPATPMRSRLGAIGDQCTRLIVTMRVLLGSGDGLVAYGLSLVSWSLQVATYAVGALAVGVHLSVVAAIASVVAVNVAGVLRATPGNVGVFQVMFALAVASYGISRPAAVAAAMLIQTVQLLSAIVAGTVASVASAFAGDQSRAIDS